jgi:integrase
MSDQRVTVWVQRFKDRPALMLQWIDPDTGRRKSKSAGTADEKKAEKARADLEYELNHGRYQEASRMTWEHFRELFEDEYASGRRERTRINFRNTFDLLEKLCHPGRLRSVTERTVSAFAAGMRQYATRGKAGLQPSTIKVRLQFLHTALAWAVEQKMLPGVPKFPSVKVPKKKPQPVPPESFERLLAKAPDQLVRAYLLTGWLAGLRLAEAFSLEWEATEEAPYLDFGRNRVVLPARFAKAVEDQWVPLDAELRAVLEALPRTDRRVFPLRGPNGRALTVNGVCRLVRSLAKKAGVKLSMHSLRKGFGCWYAGKVPAQVLQKLMRHGDIKTTMAYYANVDEAVEEAISNRQRNSLRNIPGENPVDATEGKDASSSRPSTNVCGGL